MKNITHMLVHVDICFEQIEFVRGMDKLLASQMTIKEVVTDGHLGIAALMSKYKIIVHL